MAANRRLSRNTPIVSGVSTEPMPRRINRTARKTKSNHLWTEWRRPPSRFRPVSVSGRHSEVRR
ncbi:protein of unknown function [Azospirillum lipoferum 4B]|uniref:Uncharacterized protein n=1 Tax=Azospirillum lipoferum (strain 4B) TaxID=862719 RepID=G7Z766_AZOL4|nr:protein of unknown function [Azospirillum lipoferum 4B]